MKLLETQRMGLFFRQWFTRPRASTLDHKLTPTETKATGAEEQFQRGLEFEGGKGVVQDYAQAVHWYALAAEQNHRLAQLNLAMLYEKGQGVARDETKSLMWLTRAAQLGNASAQYRLGVHQHLVCRKSLGGAVSESRIEALKWLRLSAGQGYRPAECACEFVALGMTHQEVAESALRVGAFVAG